MSGKRCCHRVSMLGLSILTISGCGAEATGPNPVLKGPIGGRWIAETETATFAIEIGAFTQTCYQSDFGGTACISHADVTGSITSAGQTSAITGTASTPAPTYDAIDFTPVSPVEKGSANCALDSYYAVVKPAPDGVSAQVLSYCSSMGRDASSRTQILRMRRP